MPEGSSKIQTSVPQREWKMRWATTCSACMAPSVLWWFLPQYRLRRKVWLKKIKKIPTADFSFHNSTSCRWQHSLYYITEHSSPTSSWHSNTRSWFRAKSRSCTHTHKHIKFNESFTVMRQISLVWEQRLKRISSYVTNISPPLARATASSSRPKLNEVHGRTRSSPCWLAAPSSGL